VVQRGSVEIHPYCIEKEIPTTGNGRHTYCNLQIKNHSVQQYAIVPSHRKLSIAFNQVNLNCSNTIWFFGNGKEQLKSIPIVLKLSFSKKVLLQEAKKENIAKEAYFPA